MICKLGLYSKPPIHEKPNHQLDHPICFLKNIIDGNLPLNCFHTTGNQQNSITTTVLTGAT